VIKVYDKRVALTFFSRKVNQSILTSAEALTYRCENSAHNKKPAALLQRVSLSARGRLAGATFAGDVLLLSCKISDCERSEYASFAQGEVSRFNWS
jgi:hypothetical protein